MPTSTANAETKSEQTGAQTLKAPGHLSKKMKAFWLGAQSKRKLQAHEILILTKAAEAFDEGERARRAIKKLGATYQDRFQQPKPRPEVSIERDCRAQFVKFLREIHLRIPQVWEG